MGKDQLSNEQNAAIKRSINLGRTLQIDHPEIAEMYVSHTRQEVAKRLDIQSRYHVSDNVATKGVHKSIAGHVEGFGIEPYEGLIPDEGERERIGKAHEVHNRQKNGRKIYEEGNGIFGRTAEQHTEDSRKGGAKSAISRGRVPLSDAEKEDAYQSSLNPEFQRGSKSNCKLIARKLNRKYHKGEEVRNSNAVKVLLYKHRKYLNDLVE